MAQPWLGWEGGPHQGTPLREVSGSRRFAASVTHRTYTVANRHYGLFGACSGLLPLESGLFSGGCEAKSSAKTKLCEVAPRGICAGDCGR